MLSSILISLLVLTQLIPITFLTKPLSNELDESNQINIGTTAQTQPLVYQPLAPQKITLSLGIEVSARSALVYDPDSQTVLFQKNINQLTSIASLTKLMTALVFLENNPGFDQEAELIEADQVPGGNLAVKNGEKITVGDIFHASLVGSANNATEALARLSGLPRDQFIELMNQRVADLGLSQTKFNDVTGLSSDNVSTAAELIRIVSYAFNNSFISQATSTPEYSFETRETKRTIKIENTNKLFDSFVRITGSKTGFTDDAGYCLAVKTDDGQGHNIIILVLGSANSEDRFQEAKGLISWAFENWHWPKD